MTPDLSIQYNLSLRTHNTFGIDVKAYAYLCVSSANVLPLVNNSIVLNGTMSVNTARFLNYTLQFFRPVFVNVLFLSPTGSGNAISFLDIICLWSGMGYFILAGIALIFFFTLFANVLLRFLKFVTFDFFEMFVVESCYVIYVFIIYPIEFKPIGPQSINLSLKTRKKHK